MTTSSLEEAVLNTGWKAKLQLKFVEENNKTVLKERSHQGPLQVQKAFYPESSGACHVYMLHPPGGVVGGDSFDVKVDVGANAKVLITTPAAGKFYRSAGDIAYQKQAIKVADLFLVKGQILTTHGRHPSSRHEYVARANDILAGLPLIVLVNGRSASASEIVAAALQDQKRALIVGTSSFGKGSVQTVTRLPNDGELTLTWSRFVTPSGYVLHNLGVPPNICSMGLVNNYENIVSEAVNMVAQFVRIKKAWREVGVDNKLEREALKQKCPASSKQREVDTIIAEKLILDSALYSRILGLSSSFASAGN